MDLVCFSLNFIKTDRNIFFICSFRYPAPLPKKRLPVLLSCQFGNIEPQGAVKLHFLRIPQKKACVSSTIDFCEERKGKKLLFSRFVLLLGNIKTFVKHRFCFSMTQNLGFAKVSMLFVLRNSRQYNLEMWCSAF